MLDLRSKKNIFLFLLLDNKYSAVLISLRYECWNNSERDVDILFFYPDSYNIS